MTWFSRYKERIKTAAITILTISAVLLAGQAGYYSAFISAFGYPSSVAAGEQDGSLAGGDSFFMSMPLSVAICFADGERRACQHDTDELEDVYGRFSAFLGEALGSASEPSDISEARWRNALSGECVYFSFAGAIPFSVLSNGLGAEAAHDVMDVHASDIIISCSDDVVRLLYMAENGMEFYICDTDVSASFVSAAISQFEANGAYFAYEKNGLSSLWPYTMISTEPADILTISAEVPFTDDFVYEHIFSAFDMNSSLVVPYSEEDGTRVFVAGDKTLRILPNGTAAFRIASQSGASGSAELVSSAGAAISLALQTAGAFAGDAELTLTAARYDEDSGEYTFTMQYIAGAIEVELQGGEPAAEIVVLGGEVIRADIRFLSFEFGDADASVLPAVQAAAAAAQSGGRLRLAYIEEAAATFRCGWVVD